MYIEFDLSQPDDPTNKHDRIGILVTCLNIDIDDWVRKHDIQYHKTKYHKNTYRLVLKNDEAYSHFALTWNPKYYISRRFKFKQPK